MYDFTRHDLQGAKVGDSIYVVGKYDSDVPSIRKLVAVKKTQVVDDKGTRWTIGGREWGSGDSGYYSARARLVEKLPEAEAFLKETLEARAKEREVRTLASKLWQFAQGNGFHKMDVERLRRIMDIVENKQPVPQPFGEILREGE